MWFKKKKIHAPEDNPVTEKGNGSFVLDIEDLENQFSPEVSADTQRLKEAMDKSWGEIISQFNDKLRLAYREAMSQYVKVRYIRLKYPMPPLVAEALKKAKQPIGGHQLDGEGALFNQIVTQSYETTQLKLAIQQSDFQLEQFYYWEHIVRDDVDFVILLEAKQNTVN